MANLKSGGSGRIRWTILLSVVFAFILIPFFLWDGAILAFVRTTFDSAANRWFIAAVVFGLLASDLFLPVPSSFVGTGAGLALGFSAGLAASWAGMMVCCLAGYWLGAKAGPAVVRRYVGDTELATMQNIWPRFGAWTVIVCRPVPMLAEVSVVAAGLAGMPVRQFLLLTALSNLGISAVYAAVGALAFQSSSFLLAFAGALVLPGIAMLLGRGLRRSQV